MATARHTRIAIARSESSTFLDGHMHSLSLMTPAWIRILPMMLFLFSLCLGSNTLAQEPDSLSVSGDLVRTMRFDAQALARLPQQDISESRQLHSREMK